MPQSINDRFARRISCGGKLIVIIDVLLLISGIIALISSTLIISKTKDVDSLIDNSSHRLLIFGGLLVLIGLIRILCIYCLNKCFLGITAVMLLCMLVAHAIIFIVLVSNENSIENHFKEKLISTVDSLNSNKTNITALDCDYMKMLSKNFFCCGYNGTSDFKDNKIAFKCCYLNENVPGCMQTTIDTVKEQVKRFLVTPSVIILGLEAISIFVSMIVCSCSNNAAYTNL